MNLFTTYTNEETKFLLEIGDRSFPRKINSLFNGVNINELDHFYRKKIIKKEVITNFEFVFVESGKVGVVKDGKIIKILNENDCFGLLNVFLKEDYVLLVLEDSEITFFGIGKNIAMYKNIMEYFVKKIKDTIVIPIDNGKWTMENDEKY
ncbi:hypothetical protein JCM11957_14420 [Caminibacter profundus]